MKKELLFAASIAMFSALNAATIDKVIIRQQWPWSTDVKVEYLITGVESPVDITVEAYDGDKPLDSAKLASSMKGDLFGIANDNYYSFTIDPVKAFGKSNIAVMNFNVRLSTTASAANMTDVLYKIVDLNSGSVTDVRRADFYGGKYGAFETSYSAIKEGFSTDLQDVLIWTDVTNNPIYKTDFLVLRHIPASSWGPWKMGMTEGLSNTGMYPKEHIVQLTSDYFIGVFPVTQAQYKKVMGFYGRWYSNSVDYADHLYKPASGVKWSEFRSASKRVDSKNEPPEEKSFCGLLRVKTNGKLSFDLPTEAQWEFAARGGVFNNSLYHNDASWMGATIHELAWTGENIQTAYETVQTVSVGRKYPNAFGLYDMLGNVLESCRDYTDVKACNFADGEVYIDPMGVNRDDADVLTSNNYKCHVGKGGSIENGRTYSTCGSRFVIHENDTGHEVGARLMCTVNE